MGYEAGKVSNSSVSDIVTMRAIISGVIWGRASAAFLSLTVIGIAVSVGIAVATVAWVSVAAGGDSPDEHDIVSIVRLAIVATAVSIRSLGSGSFFGVLLIG